MNKEDRINSEIDKTKIQWRELGFYYDVDLDSSTWVIRGSKRGIMKFADFIEDYAKNPRNQTEREHIHLLPYRYLSITTWKERMLTKDGIAGSTEDLLYFANILKQELSKSDEKKYFEVGEGYASNSAYKFSFYIENDDFDPSSLDSFEWADNWK